MAKIRALPGIKIIDMLKGTLDFYLWKGIPCVRKWPSSPGHIRSVAVMARWPAFTYIAKAWRDLDPEIQTLYNDMAQGTILTGRDLFTRSYLSGAFAYPTVP